MGGRIKVGHFESSFEKVTYYSNIPSYFFLLCKEKLLLEPYIYNFTITIAATTTFVITTTHYCIF